MFHSFVVIINLKRLGPFFAGHDTTASAMSFILLALAQNPEVQEKCRTEIDSILADRDTDEIQ